MSIPSPEQFDAALLATLKVLDVFIAINRALGGLSGKGKEFTCLEELSRCLETLESLLAEHAGKIEAVVGYLLRVQDGREESIASVSEATAHEAVWRLASGQVSRMSDLRGFRNWAASLTVEGDEQPGEPVDLEQRIHYRAMRAFMDFMMPRWAAIGGWHDFPSANELHSLRNRVRVESAKAQALAEGNRAGGAALVHAHAPQEGPAEVAAPAGSQAQAQPTGAGVKEEGPAPRQGRDFLAFAPGGFVYRGKLTPLGGKPLQVLQALYESRWRRCSAEQLLKQCWRADTNLTDEAIRSHVSAARRALVKAMEGADVKGPANPIPVVDRGSKATAWRLLDLP